MAALVFLALGLLCGLIGRVMLMLAAFGVSIWWGLGVCLPFGPIVFRLSYPDLANPSRLFRLASLPCLFMYFLVGPGITSTAFYRHKIKGTHPPSRAVGYAMEARTQTVTTPGSEATTKKAAVTLASRMQANAAEFDRLQIWSDNLRLRKRDLLHSDVQGSRVYDLELAKYTQALETATAEKKSLASAK